MRKLHRLVPHRRPLRRSISQASRKEFQSHIFSWWKTHRRDLPWRHTHDPYKIFVSEIMLQQTQVSRVIPKYLEFIHQYPTVNSLAKASTSDVLRLWKGMGYNRRALYLKKSALLGEIPKTEKELMKLPGVGKYTARAILVFAYKQDIAMVDTNIRQILTHFFFGDAPQKEKVIQQVADQLLPKGKSWEWHQALMDYGAMELEKIPGVIKKQKKFKNSNRYFRGKLMDILREGPVKEYSSPIVTGLIKDGLVVKKDGMLLLPD